MPLFQVDSWYKGERALIVHLQAESLAAAVRSIGVRWPSTLTSSCIRVLEDGSEQGELTTSRDERFVVRRVGP